MKQLIRDAIHSLAAKDAGVQAELETFVTRQIRVEPGEAGSDAVSGRKFLARVLVAPAPLARITEEYVRDLTGESLQSADQVFRAAKALGVAPNALGTDAKDLKTVFDARNQIIHEMDIRLEAKTKKSRKRRSRTIDDMTGKADGLLDVGRKLIDEVERKLKP